MSLWSPAEIRLVDLLANVERGPSRQALFALWLTVRVATGILPPTALDGKAQRKRVGQLRRRLGSLSLPPALRRTLTAIYPKLETGDPDAIVTALTDLSAVARASLGPHAAQAVDRAVEDLDRYRNEHTRVP